MIQLRSASNWTWLYFKASFGDSVVVFVIFICGLFQWVSSQQIENYNADSSIYIELTKNLLRNGSYEFNFKAHTVYPPGFALLLAAISLTTGSTSYSGWIGFIPLFSSLGLVFTYFALKPSFGGFVSAAGCLLLASSAPLFDLATRYVLSDLPYATFSMAALWALVKLDQKNDLSTGKRLALAIFLILATVSAILIRSCGVALSAGLLAWALVTQWRNRYDNPIAKRTAVGAAILCATVFSLWISWTKSTQQDALLTHHMDTYASQFTMKDPHQPELGKASSMELVQRMAANLVIQISHFSAIFTRLSSIAARWYSPWIVVPFLLLLFGIIETIRSNRGAIMAWYFLAYFGTYSLWPFDEGPRFMLPVAPIAFALFFRGGTALSAEIIDKKQLVSTLLSGLFLILGICGFLDSQPGLQARSAPWIWLIMATLVMLNRVPSFERWRMLHLDRHLRLASAVLLCLMLFLGFRAQFVMAQSNLAPSPTSFRHYASADCAAWLQQAPPGNIMAQQSAILHRLTGRLVIPFPITSNPEQIVLAAGRLQARFLVVNDEVPNEYFFPIEVRRYALIQARYPQLLQLIHTGPGYRVFQFHQ